MGDADNDGFADFTLEFFESFDDVADAVDADWSNGIAGTNPSGLGGLDFSVNVNAIPEPGSLALLASAGIGLIARRRRS